MNWRTGLAVGLTLAACVGGWILNGQLTQARGGLAWELRYVLVGLGVALLLGAAEGLAGRLVPGREAEAHDHSPSD